MATVIIQKRPRKDHYSYPVYFKDPVTGRRKYYKTFQRKKDAQQAANELRSLLDAGKVSDVKKSKQRINLQSFKEISDHLSLIWKDRVDKHELSQTTYKGYCDRVKLVNRAFGKRILCEISHDDILKYRDKISAEHSNATSNRSLFIIKQVFKHGLELNAIKDGSTARIPYLSERDHERNLFILPPDLNKLIESCQQLRAKYYLPSMIYLGAEHGASKQEVLDLKWSDIDFDFEGIGLIRLFRTKNKKERTEYFMPRTKQALLEWREHQRWMRLKKRVQDKGLGYVFCRLDGRRLLGFNKSWRNVCKIAGLNGLHFHDLRHTYCSNLILSGADIKDVKEMIGHKDLKMTDRYTHLTNMRKRSKQIDLARFYANGNGTMEPSGEHIGNTEGKIEVLAQKKSKSDDA